MASASELKRRDDLRASLRAVVLAVRNMETLNFENDGHEEMMLHTVMHDYIVACAKHAGVAWKQGINPLGDEWCAALLEVERKSALIETRLTRLEEAVGLVESPAIKNLDRTALDKMFAWRDATTDHWGDDLVSTLMAQFRKVEEGYYAPFHKLPEEHFAALAAFQAMSEEDQYRVVEEYVNRTA